MDGEWVCGTCRSISLRRTNRCYSCGQIREPEAPTVAAPPTAQRSRLSLGGAVTMVCPTCGTPRLGWSKLCRSCGLSFDEHAVAQVVQAASVGPTSLARLLLRRTVVLIPGLLLLVVLLLVAALLPPR